jgi:predicted rRNA methylase YqxC with S4 and FtsJ domains
MTAVEASLRLDAVASGGFGISRSKMVSLIEGGNAMVNWIAVKNPAHNIEVNVMTNLHVQSQHIEQIYDMSSDLCCYCTQDGSGNKR